MRKHTVLWLSFCLGMSHLPTTGVAEETNFALNSIVIARPMNSWNDERLGKAVDGDKTSESRFQSYSPCEFEFWFPRSAPVAVTKVNVFLGPENWAPTTIRYKGEIQAWTGSDWKLQKSFEQACDWKNPVTWEGAGLVTSALRLVVHESDWRLAGGGGGGDVQLYELEAFGPDQGVPALNVTTDLSIKPEGLKDPMPFVDSRVFPFEKECRFTVKLTGTGPLPAGRYTLRGQIRDWHLNPLETLPEQALAGDRPAEKTFTWKAKEQGPYLLDACVVKDGAVVGFTRELFGVRDDRLFATGEISPLPGPVGMRQKTMEELMGKNRILFSLGDFPGPNLSVKARTVQMAKDAGYDAYKIWQSWDALEPLPGVYSFSQIDKVFAYAAQADIGVGICLNLQGTRDIPEWLHNEISLYQNGTFNGEFLRGYVRGLSNYGEKTRAHRSRLAQLLAARYGKNPLLAAWQPNPTETEAGITESGSSRKDYSRWAAREFRIFLREFKGWDLEQLNQRWGTDYCDWEDLQPPHPAFELTGNHVNALAIDVRPAWLDWEEYREWSHTLVVRSVVEPLRAASPDTPMNLWSDLGWGESYFLPYLKSQQCGVAFCAMGHGDGQQIPKHAMSNRQFAVPYRNEYHTLAPGSIGAWDGGMYDQLAMEAKFYDWIGMIPSSTKEVFPTFSAFFSTGRVKAVLNALSEARRPQGQIGYLWSMLATQLQGKGGCWYVDVETWTRMMAVGDYTKLTHKWVEPFNFGGPLGHLSDCRAVLIEAAQVIPDGDAGKVAEYVKNGGKVVMPWVAGRYLRPALGEKTTAAIPTIEAQWLGVTYRELKPTYPLLSALGYREAEKLPQPARRGVLSLSGEHPSLKGLDGISVQFVEALDPLMAPGSKVISTVTGKPAALVWPLGKGEVVLLGFIPVDMPIEDSVMAQAGWFDKAKTDEINAASSKSGDELKQVVRRLLDNLHAWTSVKPDLDGPDSVLGHYGRDGDTHYALLMNYTHEKWDKALAQTGTVWKFPSLPDGNYIVSLIRIAGEEELGTHSAADLREKGVTLDFKPQEFIAIRVKPAKG